MRPWLLSLLPVLGLLTAAVPARAQERAYSYSVVHPFYGTIGAFTESIARSGDTNVMPAWVPGGFETFVDEVVPILQRRGLFREEYEGKTLRDHLGLPRPTPSRRTGDA